MLILTGVTGFAFAFSAFACQCLRGLLLRHVGPAQHDRFDLSKDILAQRETQLLPGLLGYARQEPRARAILTQSHGRQDLVRIDAFVATI